MRRPRPRPGRRPWRDASVPSKAVGRLALEPEPPPAGARHEPEAHPWRTAACLLQPAAARPRGSAAARPGRSAAARGLGGDRGIGGATVGARGRDRLLGWPLARRCPVSGALRVRPAEAERGLVAELDRPWTVRCPASMGLAREREASDWVVGKPQQRAGGRFDPEESFGTAHARRRQPAGATFRPIEAAIVAIVWMYARTTRPRRPSLRGTGRSSASGLLHMSHL